MSAESIDSRGVRRSALIVTVLGALLGGPVSIILGALAIASAESSPERARTLTSFAWLLLILGWLFYVAAFLLLFLGGEPG